MNLAVIFLLLFHGGHVIFAILRLGTFGPMAIAMSFASFACLILSVNILLDAHAAWLGLANVILFAGYGGLSSYFFYSKGHLDWAVIANNFSWAPARESREVVWSSLDLKPLFMALGACCLHLVASAVLPLRVVDFFHVPAPPWVAAVLMGMYLLIFFARYDTHDELLQFLKSVRHYYVKGRRFDIALPEADDPKSAHPLVHDELKFHGPDPPAEVSRPHVFLVMIESFNAKVVEARTPEGKEYTPVFNSLIPQGLYASRFYGNSVQTVKGQLAALFSLWPSLKGNVFNQHRGIRLKSLAQTLREQGWETLFFQADKYIETENTRQMMEQNGFDAVMRLKDYQEPEDRKKIWGWGAEDGVLYRRFFQMLDRRKAAGSGGPFFSVLATINNHMTFEVPEHRRMLHPQPKNLHEKYANSIRVTDENLAVLFEELRARDYLKNSLVIITADHSFPTGDHGVFSNETGFYDESFRIPFLALWPGVLTPERVEDTVHSQLDIAPTLLDLLKIQCGPHHFQGDSLFLRDPERAVLCVQPYNGLFCVSQNSRFKYALRLSTGEEFLFDLLDDPGETRNLARAPEMSEVRTSLKQAQALLFLAQRLYETDRVWPKK